MKPVKTAAKRASAEVESAEAPPDEVLPAPLSEVAYRALMRMLLSGELVPNEILSESQIALRLGISRTPLREAIRRLEGERLLERQRGGALVVRPLQIEEYLQIVSARRLVESECARLAAGRVPEQELLKLRARLMEMMKLPGDVVTPEVAATDRDLHGLIATASGNAVLQQIVADLRTRTAMFRYGRFPARRNSGAAEHLAIIDALIANDHAGAQKAMEEHIDQVRQSILARLGAQ